MKILICTVAVALFCSCSSTVEDNNFDGSPVNANITELEQSEPTAPAHGLHFEKTSLYELLSRRQRRYAFVEELDVPRYSTTKILRTSRVPSGGSLDYGFCLGEGWGVNLEVLNQAEGPTRYDAVAAISLNAEGEPIWDASLSFEGSFEETIARLAKQAGFDYSIQSGIDVGTLKIPSSIERPVSAIITICRYFDLQIDLSANEVKIFITRE